MKKRIFLSIFLLSLIVATSVAQAQSGGESQASSADTSEQDPLGADAAVGTSFTYQGQLKDTGGNPVDDTCDFVFSLWNALTSGSQVGSNSTASEESVTDGYFTAPVNGSGEFGSTAFAGEARWLAVSVRCPSGDGDYTALSPRQALTIAPYANYALKAPWSGLTGVPSGFADGTDNNTTYAAGTGLSLSGSTFSVTGAPWSGLTGVPSGFADGTDNNTTYTAGNGLTLSSTQFSVNFAGSGSAATVAHSDHSHTNYWRTNGNSQTNPAVNFIGTMDNYALVFRVNNLQALRLEPNATSPNIIGGYLGNSVTAGVYGATIAGGGYYLYDSDYENKVTGNFGAVGGGLGNTAYSSAVVGGGEGNTASGYLSTVGGGNNNQAISNYSTVGGGNGNAASGEHTTVGGGSSNAASGEHATVSGGYDNTASGQYNTVSGGSGNATNNTYASVGGGWSNTADDEGSTVSGGHSNAASGVNATVSGGYNNLASSQGANIGGGYNNIAESASATVSGGSENIASGLVSTIGGGYQNIASGAYATVGGGYNNEAAGDYSFVAGRSAANTNVAHDGVFLFADNHSSDFLSTAANEFAVRAAGGVRLRTSSDLSTGCSLAAGSGTWSCTSDRNVKANFVAVDGQAILAQVAALPITIWNYKTQDASIQHIGPMAQDFYAAFGTGDSDTTISMVDADGVALAAIQGLNEIVEEKETRIAALEAELDARLSALEQARLSGSGGGSNGSGMLLAVVAIGVLLVVVILQSIFLWRLVVPRLSRRVAQ